MKKIPSHLEKYRIKQTPKEYSPVDQALWRFLMRQLQSGWQRNAYGPYLSGFQKLGLTAEKIPTIESLSENLAPFDWAAISVSRFMPMPVYVEFLSHGYLPIATEMRDFKYLFHNPTSDIVHDAVGLAPLLTDPDFSSYIRLFAEVAKKAIFSEKDFDYYETIRFLYNQVENPDAALDEIERTESKIKKMFQDPSEFNQDPPNGHPLSEGHLLCRIHWWTVENGLLGNQENPKHIGAGLLSSLIDPLIASEIKQFPLSLNCVNEGFNILEPPSKFYIASHFAHLNSIVETFSNSMAQKTGGLKGLEKAVSAKTVNTIELSGGVQISGRLSSFLKLDSDNSNQIIFLKFTGPTQLSLGGKELQGQGVAFHKDGYCCILGDLVAFPGQCLSTLNTIQLKTLGIAVGSKCRLDYRSGIQLEGLVEKIFYHQDRPALVTFANCNVIYKSEYLFKSAWGLFDLALGINIPSVFGGAADREKFGANQDFVAAKEPSKNYSGHRQALHQCYQQLREIRELKVSGESIEKELAELTARLDLEFPVEWLIRIEILELANRLKYTNLATRITYYLEYLQSTRHDRKIAITQGLSLAKQ